MQLSIEQFPQNFNAIAQVLVLLVYAIAYREMISIRSFVN